ncbi:MAG: TetR family transcriptional regulator [Geodermatophilaceae bacterium]|jgi:AcrR family transcriptional regulator
MTTTSMEDLAARLGISKSAIYHHVSRAADAAAAGGSGLTE